MTLVRVKGFKIFQDRHGKARCYHRASGTPIDLEKHPMGSASFLAECNKIAALAKKSDQTKPGTLGLLIYKYKSHIAFTDLAPRTRLDYQRCFNYLQPIADTALTRFNSPLIVRIRDKAAEKHGRRFGNYIKTVLALLFAWGKERGYVANNPAAAIKGIRRPKDAPQANRPWRDEEREAVFNNIPDHMRLPVALMMYCALDPQDAIKLPRTAVLEGRIDAKRGKTGEPIWLPLPAPVVDALARAPVHNAITLCANSLGRPWTVSGFRASWRPFRQRLETNGMIGLGLTLKGLRHTVATILSEMGYDERTIADMLSQKTIEMARHYSRRADKSRKLNAVIENFDIEVNRRRTNLSNPPEKSVKPGKETK